MAVGQAPHFGLKFALLASGEFVAKSVGVEEIFGTHQFERFWLKLVEP